MNMNKKLYRSARQNVIAGVCGGLAEYLNVDVTIIRLIWSITIFFGGTGLLLYLIAAIIIPKEEGSEGTIVTDEDGNETFVAGDSHSPAKNNSLLFIGGIMVLIGGLILMDKFFPFRQILRQFREYAWPIFLIILGFIIAVSAVRRRDS